MGRGAPAAKALRHAVACQPTTLRPVANHRARLAPSLGDRPVRPARAGPRTAKHERPAMSHIQNLFSSPLLSVRDHICTIGKGERTPARSGVATHVKLVRRGCFYCHLGARAVLADSSTAYICDVR